MILVHGLSCAGFPNIALRLFCLETIYAYTRPHTHSNVPIHMPTHTRLRRPRLALASWGEAGASIRTTPHNHDSTHVYYRSHYNPSRISLVSDAHATQISHNAQRHTIRPPHTHTTLIYYFLLTVAYSYSAIHAIHHPSVLYLCSVCP